MNVHCQTTSDRRLKIELQSVDVEIWIAIPHGHLAHKAHQNQRFVSLVIILDHEEMVRQMFKDSRKYIEASQQVKFTVDNPFVLLGSDADFWRR